MFYHLSSWNTFCFQLSPSSVFQSLTDKGKQRYLILQLKPLHALEENYWGQLVGYKSYFTLNSF